LVYQNTNSAPATIGIFFNAVGMPSWVWDPWSRLYGYLFIYLFIYLLVNL